MVPPFPVVVSSASVVVSSVSVVVACVYNVVASFSVVDSEVTSTVVEVVVDSKLEEYIREVLKKRWKIPPPLLLYPSCRTY